MKKLLLILLIACISLQAISQNKRFIEEEEIPLTRILFIFDASFSMADKWEGGQKFEKARELTFELLDSLQKLQQTQNIEVALRVYGHQSPVPPQDCSDSKLEVSFGDNTINLIRDKLSSIKPKGTTPIAYSLAKCENDFPDCDDCRNIIILITDGLEMCNGDPCEISLSLQKKGVALKPYIIGIDIDPNKVEILDCIGNYFDAANVSEFRQAINTIVSQVTNLTSVRVNLLDKFGKPTETNVVMSFHDHSSGDVRYTYMHTMAKNGTPDTIFLDILSVYDLKVHTIPPVYKDSIALTEGILNVVNVPAPQGTLYVDIKGGDPADSEVKCIVRKAGLSETLHILNAEKYQKLLIGLYDLEILTTPKTYINAISIDQSKTRKISIPEPGTVIINFRTPSFGTLIHENGDILTNIIDFTPDNSHYKMRLQPGYYRVVYRESASTSARKTAEFKFRVKEGDFVVENL